MKKYLISGLVDDYRVKTNLFAISPNHAIKVFQQKYPKAKDIYVLQNLFKKDWWMKHLITCTAISNTIDSRSTIKKILI